MREVVCRLADTIFHYDLKRGAPVLVSANGILLLRPISAYGDLPYVSHESWCTGDTTITNDTPVLEIHIVNKALARVMYAGGNWQKLFEEAFYSLATQLSARTTNRNAAGQPMETALVATTILRREAEFFGFCARDVPQGVHHSLDRFFRRLYLFAYHPEGARRVLKEHEPLVQTAISVKKFCRKYGQHNACE